ncbi:helix-turn-helix domain-containing protein [Dechloromonas sp. H13]|uniref:helix-turn-helix domain-containing protein n=1 Tax=Dechloromonas sp. H13 TaxID=2570193 RepID=UPI002104349C|nr:helix-turn-helix domain-containing protein [Dechloromonas sp. H13]
MSRTEAAEYLGIKSQTLAVWATTKRYNLPYVKVGRLVKYSRESLDGFIASRTLVNGGV